MHLKPKQGLRMIALCVFMLAGGLVTGQVASPTHALAGSECETQLCNESTEECLQTTEQYECVDEDHSGDDGCGTEHCDLTKQ